MEFKKPIYPIEQWNITETEFKKENNYRNETTFALSNGYIGTRGTFEEAYPFDVDTGLEGNFVNGFYESNEIRYGEANFGSPLLSQSLLNLPNLKEIHVILDGEEFTMEQGRSKRVCKNASHEGWYSGAETDMDGFKWKNDRNSYFPSCFLCQKKYYGDPLSGEVGQLCGNGGVCVKNAGRCGKSHKENKSNRGLWSIRTET